MGLVGRNEPVPGRVLRRERLFRSLDEILAGGNAWIAGMAGAGKTTLVASYLDARGVEAAWIEVESEDRDPGAFSQALRDAFGLEPDAIPLAEAGASPDLRGFVRRFVRILRERISPPAMLVLDNCHEAQAAPEFRQLLGEILRQGRPHMRVVMIGRARPPLEFTRLIAHGALVPIDDDELRLTEDESIQLQQLEARTRNPPSLERMRELHRLTDGWAAGVKLLLRRAEAPAMPLPAAAAPGGALFDYLAEEVFAGQPESVRAFLMRAAFLPHISASAATSLASSGEGEQILEALVRECLFTTRHTEGRSVRYTFHPLLRSFLLSQARAHLPAEECDTRSDAAADLLTAEGDGEAAARVLIEHARWTRLSAHVATHAAGLIARGLHRTLAAWIAALPESVKDSQPYLYYWHGMALAPRDADQAAACFEQAYRRFRQEGETTGAILAWCGAVETIAMEWSDFSLLDPWLAEADVQQIMAASTSSSEVAARYTAAMFAALLWRRPDTPAVHEWAERLLQVVEACPEPDARILLGCNLEIHYAVAVGREPELDRLIRAVEPLPGVELGVVAATLLQAMRALHLMHRGRYQQAVDAARAGTTLAREHGLRLWDFLLAAIEVYALLNGGELRRGREALARLEKAATPRRRLEYSHYLFIASLADLLTGDASAAVRVIQTALVSGRSCGGPHQLALGYLAEAQALHAAGRRVEAEQALDRAQGIAQAMASGILRFQVLLCQALFALDAGDEERCAAALGGAFALGAAEGYVSFNYFRPDVMARLCAFALGHGVEPGYARELVRANGLRPPSPDVETWPWPVRIYTLGRFSLVVDGHPAAEAGRGQHRPTELLQALIALGGRQVSGALLVEQLWPDAHSKGGRGALESSLLRLRRLLGSDDAIVLDGGRLTLNPGLCWVDLWSFERGLGRVQAALFDPAQPKPDEMARQLREALRLWQGEFLQRETPGAWALPVRNRLLGRVEQLVGSLGKRLEAESLWEAAADLYRRAIEIDPLAETSYRRLMHCLNESGARVEAARVYASCRAALGQGLHVAPSAETEAIRRSIMAAMGTVPPPEVG